MVPLGQVAPSARAAKLRSSLTRRTDVVAEALMPAATRAAASDNSSRAESVVSLAAIGRTLSLGGEGGNGSTHIHTHENAV